MGKKLVRMLLMLGLIALLSGCLGQSGEDFYALPQLPDDYLALQQTISAVMSELGAEYAAPSSGYNTQNIQLQDLDGDGIRESAVAFFRVASAEKPLKLYIFRQNQVTKEYETTWVIEGDGTGFYSVAFENLGGTEARELVVSWQISTKVQSLACYALQSGGNVEELMRSGYTKHTVMDIDRDNEKEIVLVQLDTAEGNSRAELYNYNNGLMVQTSTAALSLDVTEVRSAKIGSLADMVPALFISSDFGEYGGCVTDIIALQDETLVNLTLDEATGMSISTIRYYTEFTDADGADVNNDGILELPIPEALPPVGEATTLLYLLHWYQYDQDGTAEQVYTTLHSYDDGWYLILPENWSGQITAARKDSAGSMSGTERAVSFYYWAGEEAEPEEFLTIYRLSGSNRSYRATRDGRFSLVELSDVIYAAKFWDAQWNCGLDKDELLERFNRIKVDWSTDS